MKIKVLKKGPEESMTVFSAQGRMHLLLGELRITIRALSCEVAKWRGSVVKDRLRKQLTTMIGSLIDIKRAVIRKQSFVGETTKEHKFTTQEAWKDSIKTDRETMDSKRTKS